MLYKNECLNDNTLNKSMRLKDHAIELTNLPLCEEGIILVHAVCMCICGAKSTRLESSFLCSCSRLVPSCRNGKDQ